MDKPKLNTAIYEGISIIISVAFQWDEHCSPLLRETNCRICKECQEACKEWGIDPKCVDHG
jgi:hypothetical protein